PRLPGPLPEGGRLRVEDGKLLGVAADGKVLWSQDYPSPTGPIPQLICRDEQARATAFNLRYSALGEAAPPGGVPAPAQEYLNFVFVPKDYDSKKACGLFIALHGGGGTDSVDQGAARSQGHVDRALAEEGSDMIRVNLGAPRIAPLKWNFPESEIHFQSVIEEYSTRYHIDPDRVFIAGTSMGGIGSWWHAFRQGDRFAAFLPVVGNFDTAYWPRLRGMRILFRSGAYDGRYQRVDWTRYAHQRLKAFGIPHIDGEFPGGHSGDSSSGGLAEVVHDILKNARRNPYPARACAVSPFTARSSPGPTAYQGTEEERVRRFPHQPYSFWTSVLETGPGGIVVEEIERGGDPTRFKPVRRMMNAGAVDAENLGGNRFRVKTTNVRRFALWLHPKMGVDLAKPIEIEVIETRVDPETLAESEQGRRKITARATPSLAAMLRYLGDRRDYGLIYHAAVEVTVGDNGG
ncbi:MAG: prolyl oligopeptidase family serine peptidase, partial [Armatimonadetes bacterium]|nr:prolyl oligopeptidase family serine peptidase [Armatimonadota bacterium]